MHQHLLTELSLPDRYEPLVRRLGNETAKLLIAPHASNVQELEALAVDTRTRDEGVLVPLYGDTGVGKTTFVENAKQWLPNQFGPTLTYEGELTFDGLTGAARRFADHLPTNNTKIIPINIDHREGSPPNDEELSTIKRFLRTSSGGVPAVVFWPETSAEIARSVAGRFTGISGAAAINLPMVCRGPDRDTWQDIAKHTLTLANQIDNLERLGVDPDDYDRGEFPTLGIFLRKLSQDFNAQVLTMRRALQKPVSVIIAFASESARPGVLSQLTSPARYGLLDAHALISVTSSSAIGRWWSSRRGLLTRTIVQLDAHAICLPPMAAASCVRNFSEEMELFDSVGYRRYGPARAVRDLGRSDLGKIVVGEPVTRHEARGNPAEDATAAFALLSEAGFNLGRDKDLNKIMSEVVAALLRDRNVAFEKVEAETRLPFCPLLPDNAIYAEQGVTCIEYTWRRGDFLGAGNRSVVAQYILKKLKNYASELGWTDD